VLLAAALDIRACLEPEFGAAGYHLEPLPSWREALALLRHRRPDALIAEALLADGPVEDRCRQVRHQFPEPYLPLLVLSPSPDAVTRERLLEAGVDDVVATPCNAREVLLRVRSIVRQVRIGPTPRGVTCVGLLCLDADACQVTVGGHEVLLTVTQFRLLAELARHWGRVCSREELLQSLWAPGQPVGVRVVDTQVRRIRRKLGPARHYLRTVRGFGYCLADLDHV